jgi:hypothetical protein
MWNSYEVLNGETNFELRKGFESVEVLKCEGLQESGSRRMIWSI